MQPGHCSLPSIPLLCVLLSLPCVPFHPVAASWLCPTRPHPSAGATVQTHCDRPPRRPPGETRALPPAVVDDLYLILLHMISYFRLILTQ